MINAILVFNNHGKPRLVRFYRHLVFVETLDKCFENVCELDLIFHMDKPGRILGWKCPPVMSRMELQIAGLCAGGGAGPIRPSCLLVHYILQEVVIGGMVLETNMNEIVAQAEAQSKLEKAEVSGSVWGLERGAQVWAQGRLGSGYHAGASVLWGGGRRELVALRVSQPAHPQGKAHRVGAPHWGVQGAASMQVLLCCQG
ncbi:adaptor-related protein complex 3, sigma 2 subunit isoform X10 [Gallus gallus]|uniref:adaptor-related protein complex 3, sigma 2 subunit isoform X10 n=1 Tax=Gallus gallus TaxID=9031 RepID=UPI001EFFA6C9|nr:adaptor-related protein complex 3, sigma 2 subunit isoform X10 [Gallus gallus]